MSKKSAPKILVVGWKIIGNLLIQSGIPEIKVRELSSVWVGIYNQDQDFNPKHIAKGILAAMKGSLLSEDKLCEKLEHAKRSYAHLLFETNSRRTIVEPEVIVFNEFLKNVMLRLKEKVSIIDLHDDLESELRGLKLSSNALIEIELWRSSLMKAMPEETVIVIELPDIKLFIHYIYIWTCEEAGPMFADQIFTEAIRVAEMLPESGKCHPKSFL